MKSTVERLGPTRVKINVEVPFDELKPNFDRAYKKIAQQVKIPGFRPGKAPARILEARLGRGVVLDEVVNEAVPTKYSEAVSTAEDVRPIGRPDIEVTQVEDGELIAFTAEVDVRPEITLPDAGSLAVTVDDVEVTEDELTEQLDALRARFGTLTGVERPAATDDFVLIDLSAKVDGVALEEATTTGYSYQVGAGGLIDGLDETVTGMSAGQTRTFTSTLVAGDHADREAEVTVTVSAVKERDLPAADDEFAQLASEFDTLEELTDDLRERASRGKRMQQAAQARDKALEAVLEATEVPLPEAVVEAELEVRMHDAVHVFDHDDEKLNEFLAEHGQTREEFDAEARGHAEEAVKTQLVLDALADAEDVAVTDQEFTERLMYQAQRMGVPPEQFVQRAQEAGQLGAIYASARRDKALVVLLRGITVTDGSGNIVDLTPVIGTGEEQEAGTEAGTEAAAESDDTAGDAAAQDSTAKADSPA